MDTSNLDNVGPQLFVVAENALLSQPTLAHSIQSLSERQILDGYRLVSKIESTREKFLLGQQHYCKLGRRPPLEDWSVSKGTFN